jgi:hypothetical protein
MTDAARLQASWLLMVLFTLGGCGSSHEGPAADAGSAEDATADASPQRDAALADAALADAATAPDASAMPDAGPAPSFDSIYESILVPRCRRCHIDEGSTSFGYRPRLTDVDVAYEALVDVPAATMWVTYCVPDGVVPYRVRPFDTETSMLAFLGSCYVRDAEHDGLTPEESEEIRRWISAGAPRAAF